MLFDVINFLFEVASTLIGGACLLRMYMHWRGMGMGNPVGRLVMAAAAPAVPPRGVVRTTWLAGSALPLFRCAHITSMAWLK